MTQNLLAEKVHVYFYGFYIIIYKIAKCEIPVPIKIVYLKIYVLVIPSKN